MTRTNGHASRRVAADALALNARAGLLADFVSNAFTLTRDMLLRRGADLRRDYDRECHYPESVTPEQYQREYDRNPVAARVVEVWPEECWQEWPEVYEDEDSDAATEFEAAFDSLGRALAGEQSWHDDPGGAALFDQCRRADVLSGIGHYGVVLIGTDDGLPLSEPAAGVEEANSAPSRREGEAPLAAVGNYDLTVNARAAKGRKLLYLRCLPEALAPATCYETNVTSPRYGLPAEYMLTLSDPSQYGAGYSLPLQSVPAHWSRVVHVCEADFQHAPRMRPVFNRLVDLTKIYGSSAEGFWQQAFARYAFETDPALGGDVNPDTQSLKDANELVREGLQREWILNGFTVKSLAPAVSDPTPHVKAAIEAICVRLAIPARIFVGSERGELASSQDAKAWARRVRQRRRTFVGPRLVAPLVNRLIMLGVLPAPKAPWKLDWPEDEALTQQEKATVFLTRMQAVSAWVSGGGDSVIPPLDMLTREAGYTEEEATSILDAAARHQAEQQAAQPQQPAAQPGGPPQPPGVQPAFPPAPSANALAEWSADDVQDAIALLVANGWSANAFCATGQGGGIDPTCPPGQAGAAGRAAGLFAKLVERVKAALSAGPKDAGRAEGQGDFKSPSDSQTVKDILSGKATHDLHSGLASSREDTALTAIMRESGRDKPPTLASKEELDALGKAGWFVAYRGVGDPKYAEQFRSGREMYNGAGTYGNGTYFTYVGGARGEQSAEAGAKMYASQNDASGKGGAVMRVAFPPGARVADHEAVVKEQSKYLSELASQKFGGKLGKEQYEKLRDLHSDVGRFAALRNYDAVRIKQDGFLLILNRSKVVAQRDDAVRNAGDNCGTGAGGFQPGNSCGKGGALPAPASENEARMLASALRKAVDKSCESSEGVCVSAAVAAAQAIDGAESWSGNYQGSRGAGPHTVVKAGGWFIDVTADQFGGPRVRVMKELTPQYQLFTPSNAASLISSREEAVVVAKIARRAKGQMERWGYGA